MGSTFVSYKKVASSPGFIGSVPDADIWLQFVPGKVKSVVTSVGNPKTNQNFGSGAQDGAPNKLNSIIAIPKYSNELRKTSTTDEANRYVPLLRGMVDVPTEGDTVLLCTFAKTNYYLGPLNTENNVNFNFDRFNLDPEVRLDYDVEASDRDLTGMSKNFPYAPALARIQKPYINPLDDPKTDKKVYREIHGDMIFEGRHGNSIRIGSRDINPYIIISNGRKVYNAVESTLDGSLVGILNAGTLRQHFLQDREIDNDSFVSKPFVLASDTVEDSKHLMTAAIDLVNPGTTSTDLVYNYSRPQILQTSDRITINSRIDSMFLTSFQHVHLGAGRAITISANQETIFDTPNIYLGKQAKIKANNNEAQGLLLGENLRALLEELVDVLLKANGHCNTAPIPLGYNGGIPGTLMTELIKIKSALGKNVNNFVSSKHFIEENA